MTIWRTAGMFAGVSAIGAAGFLYYAFGAFLPWREEREVSALGALAGIREGDVVAELGAGGGRFSLALAKQVGPQGRVFTTELSAEAVAALAARAEAEGLRNVTEIRSTRLETNLPDRGCGVLLLRNVYHHVQDPRGFALALRRALQDEGRLVVIDFDAGALWFHGGRPDDASARRAGHGVNRADAIAELTAAGFQLEKEIPDWSGPMWLAMFRAPSAAALRRP